MSEGIVLVTGGSGFVATHCIDQLLRAGYSVRATVRSLSREPEVRATLKSIGAPRVESGLGALSFVTADLSSDAGWAQAASGCRYVLHVASPFPPHVPKHEDELIIPAREGALRVLRAARDAGVQRVVMTSSFAAIGYGHKSRTAAFTEADWTNLAAPGTAAYPKSKTIAERAAWDFIAREGGSLQLSVINPTGIFGPVLSADYAPSILIVKRLLDGDIPGIPNLSFGVVDVRDVADIHLRAMTHPAANGERFLALSDGESSMLEVAGILKEKMGRIARNVPSRRVPDWVIRLLTPFSSDMKMIAPEIGKTKIISNEKARRLLGWSPRPREEAILATAESLQRLNLLKA